jgi:hypothetical protein
MCFGEQAVFIQMSLWHPHRSFTDAGDLTMNSELKRYLKERLEENPRLTTTTLKQVLQSYLEDRFSVSTLGNTAWRPTDAALRAFVERFRLSKRHHKVDSVSTRLLCEQWTESNPGDWLHFSCEHKKMLIVGQTAHQRMMMQLYGESATAIDSTHSTNKYKVPLFFLAARDCFGSVQAIGFFITQSESTIHIAEALQVFKDRNPDFNPNHFVMDKSGSQIAAVERTFPNSTILLCGLHAKWAWENALKDYHHEIPLDARAPILHHLMNALEAPSIDKFDALIAQALGVSPLSTFENSSHPHAVAYSIGQVQEILSSRVDGMQGYVGSLLSPQLLF